MRKYFVTNTIICINFKTEDIMSGKPQSTSPVQQENPTTASPAGAPAAQAAPVTLGAAVNSAGSQVAKDMSTPLQEAAKLIIQGAAASAYEFTVGSLSSAAPAPAPAAAVAVPVSLAEEGSAAAYASAVPSAEAAEATPVPTAFGQAKKLIATAATPVLTKAGDQVADALAKAAADATVSALTAVGGYLYKAVASYEPRTSVGKAIAKWVKGEGAEPTLTAPTDEEIAEAAAAPAPEAAQAALAETLRPLYNPFDDVLDEAPAAAAAPAPAASAPAATLRLPSDNVFDLFDESPAQAASDEVPVSGANNPVDDGLASLL